MLRAYACRQVRCLWGARPVVQDAMDEMQAIDPDVGSQPMPEPAGQSAHGTAAAQLLLHAQQVADELRSQAETEAADATALARQLEAQATQLYDEASADRDAAGRAAHECHGYQSRRHSWRANSAQI